MALAFLSSASRADEEKGTREEAKAMVDAAGEHVKKVGPEQAFKDFTDKANKPWQNKDLYVFAYDMEGVNVGHGKASYVRKLLNYDGFVGVGVYR